MKRCAICGKTEEEHAHLPVWIEYPDRCKCPADTWGGEPNPICDKYVGDGQCYCETCEHDKACHE